MKLKDCFREDFTKWLLREDFTKWLLKSNNPKVGPYLSEDRFKYMLAQVEKESLADILDILLREPKADYFWYTYIENGGKLSYSLPHNNIVPGNALRVDKEKIKAFLRHIKIEKLLE